MGELINKSESRLTDRRRLLAGASVAVLTTHIILCDVANAAPADQPVVWLEIGGQLDQLNDSQSSWNPEFVTGYPTGPLAGQYIAIQKRPKVGFDADGSISFQPRDTEWVFRAAIKIGRGNRSGSALVTQHNSGFGRGKYSTHYRASSHRSESHEIADFQIGKDVGLGSTLWDSSGTLRIGVRFADLRSRSDVHISTEFPLSSRSTAFNTADSHISHRFTGIGPSVSWDTSIPIGGTARGGELTLDWTAAAGILFGRQTTEQKTHASYQGNPVLPTTFGRQTSVRQNTQDELLRRRSVTVPNLGGSIGISYRLPSARISFGYRADFFFGAMDGGIDTRKTYDRGFYGPFAAISIGLGR